MALHADGFIKMHAREKALETPRLRMLTDSGILLAMTIDAFRAARTICGPDRLGRDHLYRAACVFDPNAAPCSRSRVANRSCTFGSPERQPPLCRGWLCAFRGVPETLDQHLGEDPDLA